MISANSVGLTGAATQLHTVARGFGPRPQLPPYGSNGPVEQHLLDARVVAEVLQVAGIGSAHPAMGVQVRGAVRGDLKLMPRSERRDPVPRGISTGAALAAGHQLQDRKS